MFAFFYDRPAVRVFLTGSAADAPEVRLWRFFVGIYNIFLGVGIAAGLVALQLGHETAGRTLVVYVCSFMVASGVIFLVTTPRLWQGALGQLVPAGAALATALICTGRPHCACRTSGHIGGKLVRPGIFFA